jgi:hypothetical protein
MCIEFCARNATFGVPYHKHKLIEKKIRDMKSDNQFTIGELNY